MSTKENTAPALVGFVTNVDAAALSVKKWQGKDYLVGPVVMAKEIVMNGILYPKSQLKASVSHWNGRPFVVNHPKDDEGNFVSANDPDVLEQSGLGFLFNTAFDSKDRLVSQVWIDMDRLEACSEIKERIDEGEVLEVSTGMWLQKEAKTGSFGGRKFRFVAHNLKPDHLAALPTEEGACSVEDGAGFPRVNCSQEFLEANELSAFDKSHHIGKALRKKFTIEGNRPWLEDLFDDHIIFARYSLEDNQYALYRVSYTIGDDEQTVTFTDSPKKVILKKTYVDSVETNLLQGKATKAQPTQTTETNTMKKEYIAQLLAANSITEDQAKTLESMSDEQFEVYRKTHPVPPNASGASAADDVEEESEEGDEKEETDIEANKDKPKGMSTVEANADFLAWAKDRYEKDKLAHVKTIMGNKQNAFTKTELEGMHINQLEKLARLAAVATEEAGTDMSPAGTPPLAAHTKGTAPKVQPYIPPHKRPGKK